LAVLPGTCSILREIFDHRAFTRRTARLLHLLFIDDRIRVDLR